METASTAVGDPLPATNGTLASAAERALIRAQWQAALFAEPSWSALLALDATWRCSPFVVRLHRNHGFDAVERLMGPYAAWNGLALELRSRGYDDSLSWDGAGDGDIELVWIDTRRQTGLGNGEPGDWLVARLRALRQVTARPILLAAWPLGDVSSRIRDADIPGLYICDMDTLAHRMGSAWESSRTAELTGSRLSRLAFQEVARELACRWLPAVVWPPVKAIMVDLDNTLYVGVLGEDGPSEVVLTEAHKDLQEQLRSVAAGGVLLALITRNDRIDVDALFHARRDFPLRLEDFAVIEASWDAKADAIRRATAALRIGLDSVVFVDDNPGELASVANELPVVTVHAATDAYVTGFALRNVAGLFRFSRSFEDSIRADDLRAAEQREGAASKATSPEEYLRELAVRLDFLVDPMADLRRVHELGVKTNQFVLSLRRFTEAELAERMASDESSVVAVRLSDRLSDSGIVAMGVGTVEGLTLRVEEMCVSCRALGRNLEDVMLIRLLMLMGEGRVIEKYSFDTRVGPRNQPALRWLEELTGGAANPGAEASVATLRAAPGLDGLESAVSMRVFR